MNVISTPAGDGAPAPQMRLTGEDRETLNRVFRQPLSEHVTWSRVRELFERVGVVTKLANHRYELEIGSERLTVQKPHKSHLNGPEILELRAFLATSGISPAAFAKEAADAPPGFVAAIALSKHDAILYRLHFGAPAPDGAPRAEDAAGGGDEGETGRRYVFGHGGKTAAFREIAEALSHCGAVVVIQHVDAGAAPNPELAAYLRTHPKAAKARAVHEVLVHGTHLTVHEVRERVAKALSVST